MQAGSASGEHLLATHTVPRCTEVQENPFDLQPACKGGGALNVLDTGNRSIPKLKVRECSM